MRPTAKHASFAALGAAAAFALAGTWKVPDAPLHLHLVVLAAGAMFGMADWILLKLFTKMRRLGK